MLYIYKSSAGSGKTYTLVKEFIRIALKQPDKFKHILAITFTNKAANEMKGRIIKDLVQLRAGHPKAKGLLAELSKESDLDEATITELAGNILRDILHHYSDFSVSTIDSFTHRVVRSFAYDLHLPLNFEVEMDRDKLLTETIELLMDRLSEEDTQVTNAVVEFAESNIEEGKSWNLEYRLVQLASELFKEDAYKHLDELEKIDFDQLRKAREKLYQFSASFEQGLFEEGKKAYQLIVNSGLTAQSFFQTTKGIFGFFNKYANDEFPNDPLGNSYVQKTINEDKWGGGKTSTSDLVQIEGIKQQLIQHYKNIAAHYDKQGRDYNLARLLLRNFYSFILLTDIQKVMNEYKKENNIVHISEFQKRVNSIVREQEAPVIYERLGEWYDSILIDEFQDTSVLQWQNLLPLIENSQFKGEDSMVVGDGKQAIYRFRGGEVHQFAVLPKIYHSDTDSLLKEREVAINNYGAEVRNLGFNFRSRKEIVNFNNRFYEVLSGLPGLPGGNIYDDQKQEQGRKTDGGYVRIDFLSIEDELSVEDLRNLKVEALIKEANGKGYSYHDIAILTRSNKNGSLLASYLIERGVQVISSESLLINNSPRVKLLLSTLNYFDRRQDHIVRAEMVYYVHLLLLNKDFHFKGIDFDASDTLFEGYLSSLMNREFHSYDFLSYPLVDLIHELIRFFGFNEDDPFLQFFQDETMLFASRNRSNIREFLDWWEEEKGNKSIIYPDTLDAVRIMTIHKSKGLQFPVVIMADADWPQKNSKRNFWIGLNKPWLKELPLGIIPVTSDVMDTDFSPLYEGEEADSLLDLLNLIYVATTRAEDMLFILSAEVKKEPDKNNSVTALLINFLKQQGLWDGFHAYEFGDVSTVRIKDEGRRETLTYEKQASSVSNSGDRNITIRKNSQLLWNEEVVEKINWGNLVHEMLKQVRYASDVQSVIDKALNGGLVTGTEAKRLEAEVSAIVNHPEIAAYFLPPYRVINERAIFSPDYSKIPDRIVIHNDVAIVLDYKTGDGKPDHKQQVSDYANELRKFGVKEARKFLVYTEGKRVEEL